MIRFHVTGYRFLLLASLPVVAAAPPVAAQDASRFPSKPVHVFVAEAAGGGTDIQARLFGQKMADNLGQPFVIENRSGGGLIGVLTASEVKKAPPDGHALLAITPSFLYAPYIEKNYPLDPVKDFAPVSLLTRAPYLLVVHPSVPAKSIKELVAYGQANPGKLNFGAGARGTGTHLVTEWFFSAANIKFTYVPYKGTALAASDLFAGRLDGAMGNVLSSLPNVKAGKVRALGISTAQRSRVLPDLPTIAEQGVAGYDASTFHGYVAPSGTPSSILNKLATEYAKVVNSPDVAQKISQEGADPVGSTPEEFKAAIARETQVWRTLIVEKGLKVTE